MQSELKNKRAKQLKRAIRVRRHLKKHSTRPRLLIIKTNKHIFSQLINDVEGKTIAGSSTLSKESKEKKLGKKSLESARFLGAHMAALAQSNGIESVVLDRGRFKYHGLIKQFADAAREAGLKF